MASSECQLEDHLIQRLLALKYEYRSDIRDRAALEANFCKHFESLNKVPLTDPDFVRLLAENRDTLIVGWR